MQFIFGNFRRDCYVLKLFFYKVIKMKIFHFSHFWVRKINESKNLYLKILRLTAQRTHSGSIESEKNWGNIFSSLYEATAPLTRFCAQKNVFHPTLLSKLLQILFHPIIQASQNFIPPYYPSSAVHRMWYRIPNRYGLKFNSNPSFDSDPTSYYSICPVNACNSYRYKMNIQTIIAGGSRCTILTVHVG